MTRARGHLTGKDYYYTFLAGAKKILENQRELDRINVFPVPDADTGSNLASTVRAIVERVRPSPSYKATSAAIASAALEGARGNSGVIFAQFLYGIGAESGGHHQVSVAHFAQSLRRAVRYMYEAIAEPVEGTMITVIRKWAEYVESRKEESGSFLRLLTDSYGRALEALQETRHTLEAMRKADVVDAGSKRARITTNYVATISRLNKSKDPVYICSSVGFVPQMIAESISSDQPNIIAASTKGIRATC